MSKRVNMWTYKVSNTEGGVGHPDTDQAVDPVGVVPRAGGLRFGTPGTK